MFLSKLVNVLSALDKSAYKRLPEYVHSPYFKIPAASVDLFNYLHSVYPNFTERKMQPEVIGKMSRNLNTRAKAARAGSELLTAVEHFIALEDWKKQPLRVDWHMFNGLQKIQLLNQFESELSKAFERLESDPEQDIETFYYKHIYAELSNTGFDALLNRTIRNDLSPILRSFDEYYALKLLRYMCEAVSRKQVLGVNYNDAHMVRVLDILSPYTNTKYPYPYLFVNIYRMLKAESFEEGENYYQLIKKFIDSQAMSILPNSSIESMSYAISWCLFWNLRGYAQTADEYLWWIQLKIKYGLLLENGKMLPISFRNTLVLAASGNQKPEWMKSFIAQYAPLLPDEHRDTNIAFGEGLYYYKTQQYTKAIQAFLTAQAKDEVIFNAIIRRWQYMSVYEQNASETELLLNQLESFDKYIARNREAFHQMRSVFDLFISYSRRLLDRSNEDKRISLRQALEKEAFFPGKPWLLDKLSA